MADYFPVISRAVAQLDPNTGEARRAVYERARAAIVRQLKSIDPPLAEEDISRERTQLEEAIRRVEAGAAGGEAAAPRQQPAAPPSPRPAAPQPAAPKPEAAPQAKPAPAAPQPSAKAESEAKAAAPRNGQKGGQKRPATRADGRPIVQSAGVAKGKKKGGGSGLAIALGALAVIAIGVGLFLARGQIAALLPGASQTQTASTDPKPDSKPAEDAKPAEPETPPAGEAKPTDEAKTDDRLPQEQAGGETPPPAGQQTPPADQPVPPTGQPAPSGDQQARAPDATAPAPQPEPAPASPPPAEQPAAQQPGPLVAQRAVLYEEGPNQQSGEALTGSVVWRTESVAGGQNRPLETALKGEIDIPGRNLRAVLTIRRNLDATLPASHTIEIQFTLPSDFPNAGVTNVPGVLMKTDESARGAAVAGLSVKVTNGFFLIGLSNVDSEKSVNEQLLRDRGWIDVPILYDNGRRAVLTLEKGTPGKQAFQDAFDAWKSASAAPR